MLTISEYRKAVRNPYAWPGGYALQAITHDGEILCRKCLKTERRSILEDLKDQYGTGWGIEGFDILWEGPDNYCAHCSDPIPTEYGDPEENK